jgi:SAM-dependent methyltransferase/uncharacterized protein YbaR (Trm112 family)
MDSWYLDNLVCPRDHEALQFKSDKLICPHQHRYPVVNGVPVMLLDGIDQTLHVAEQSMVQAQIGAGPDGWYIDSVGLNAQEQAEIGKLALQPGRKIDPVVAYLVGATNGIAYRHLLGRLDRYPIPHLRLPAGQGRTLLDVGCNWGRWSVAAARKGYQVIGIDPSLGAIMAARRVARELGLNIHFIVGDARHLPLRTATLDTTFSYSVLQHFSRTDAATAVSEMGRVLHAKGTSFVQMPTKWGVRCLYHQARRQFREPTGFDVRYYSLGELLALFGNGVGRTQVSVDCFLGIGLQPSDWDLMSWKGKVAIVVSEVLRFFSRALAPLRYLADSVYLTSLKV